MTPSQQATNDLSGVTLMEPSSIAVSKVANCDGETSRTINNQDTRLVYKRQTLSGLGSLIYVRLKKCQRTKSVSFQTKIIAFSIQLLIGKPMPSIISYLYLHVGVSCVLIFVMLFFRRMIEAYIV